ncbi:peptidyl-prolyl cis-trans isomerase H-like [Xenopus laevis]|uniref:Peptidyl-prolyl cis-trans isomerase H-like n=1 Tax=Xenopus laevis TaxID=8355 RepID=A0A8J0T6V2_XENLA|nr:peptidyl-prolyl cis-trans isomerase H-like [Xenopus laevis]
MNILGNYKHDTIRITHSTSAKRKEVGRMKVELFADVVPKTAENFRQFCTGEFRCMNLHFTTMNFICHLATQIASLSRSFSINS